MLDWRSRAHVRWECKYHVVIIPKCRRKVTGGCGVGLDRSCGTCASSEAWSLIEGKAMADHVAEWPSLRDRPLRGAFLKPTPSGRGRLVLGTPWKCRRRDAPRLHHEVAGLGAEGALGVARALHRPVSSAWERKTERKTPCSSG